MSETVEQKLEGANGCLIMIHDRLVRHGCCCAGDNSATPPMWYDDWISCAIRKAKRDGAAEANAALLAACKALVEYQESTDLDDEPEDGEYGDGKRALVAARAAIALAEPTGGTHVD